jgi:chromosome segregation ATPase
MNMPRLLWIFAVILLAKVILASVAEEHNNTSVLSGSVTQIQELEKNLTTLKNQTEKLRDLVNSLNKTLNLLKANQTKLNTALTDLRHYVRNLDNNIQNIDNLVKKLDNDMQNNNLVQTRLNQSLTASLKNFERLLKDLYTYILVVLIISIASLSIAGFALIKALRQKAAAPGDICA